MTNAAAINTALTGALDNAQTLFGGAATLAVAAAVLGVLIWAFRKVRG